jgi:hypothetical protein
MSKTRRTNDACNARRDASLLKSVSSDSLTISFEFEFDDEELTDDSVEISSIVLSLIIEDDEDGESEVKDERALV